MTGRSVPATPARAPVPALLLRFVRGWAVHVVVTVVVVASTGDTASETAFVAIVYGLVSLVVGLPAAALLDFVIRDALPLAGHVALVGLGATAVAVVVDAPVTAAPSWPWALGVGTMFALSRLVAGFRDMPTWARDTRVRP